MKIWLLRRRYNSAGGAERFTQRLAGMLAQKGHEVWIAAEEWPDSDNYKVQKISSRSSWGYSQACAKEISWKDKVVFSLERTSKQHIYRAGDGIHASWLKRREKYQTKFQKWLSSWTSKHQNMLALEKEVFNSSNTQWVVANSQLVKNEIRENFSFPEDHIKVIHPGVDLKAFQPCTDKNRRKELRDSFGVPDDAVVWSFVGSGFERKGLLWAVKMAAAQKIPVCLLVLGKGSRRIYDDLAEKIDFTDRLRFLAAGTKALDVYHASDAFILPTIYDPCSNACLEAAACGLPVITTKANGAGELTSGIVIEDPAKIGEAAEKASAYAHPLVLDKNLDAQREKLDEKPCWDALLGLIQNVGV